MVLCCVGDGSFSTPYHLELKDSMVRAGLELMGPRWRELAVGLNNVLRTVPEGVVNASSPAVVKLTSWLTIAQEVRLPASRRGVCCGHSVR